MKILEQLVKRVVEKWPQSRLGFFVVGDVVSMAAAVWLSFLLRFEGQIASQHILLIERVILLMVAVGIPIFFWSRLYSFTWGYVGVSELFSLARALTLTFVLMGVLLYLARDSYAFEGFPRSTLFISSILTFFFTGAIRLAKRMYKELEVHTHEGERTLIVGAGDAGAQLVKSILSSSPRFYFPVGFVDDDVSKIESMIHGVRVMKTIEDIPELASSYQIESIIIALPSAGSRLIRRAVELGRKAGITKIKIVPSLVELLNGEVSIGNLREVQVEDLLGRESISLDTQLIKQCIAGRTIAITGAAGSIGAELSRQVAQFLPSQLLLIDHDETGIFRMEEEFLQQFPYVSFSSFVTDVRDESKMKQIFRDFHPSIVFHAAAYKHVPLMEKHPDEAVKNNIFGTFAVAGASMEYGVEKFVFISTDKAVDPTSVMGATKRVGEMICQVLNQKNHTRFISVRFGNVLDSRGSVIPVFREQIKRGGPVTVTHPEMKRYFMSTSEACLLVMQAGAMGKGGEVFVLDMGHPIKIVDLAREMIRLSGLEPDQDIPIVFTGPRIGEKFFEDILSASEQTVATQNQKILRAELSLCEEHLLEEGLRRLREAIDRNDRDVLRETLRMLVPSYHTQ
ncbi:MAG: nucleoside-diphosphate sugar epimerase/dehydratase [Patescibacteria group bacterium]